MDEKERAVRGEFESFSLWVTPSIAVAAVQLFI
jgi:hypothetical protein